MTIREAKAEFADEITKLINKYHLPPTMIREVLFDLDSAIAQLEEQQYQQSIAEKEVKDA